MEGNVSEIGVWRTATIFISSTFQDMQYERDCINEIVVPALKEFFKFYRIAVRTIDLRWGVNTIDNAEKDIEASILNVCLNEIDRSRPFFIGIVGDRYGWIPPSVIDSDDRSVTEMEIDYGALRDRKSLENAVICLRKLDNIPDSLHSRYYEKDIVKQQKVRKLQKRLTEIYSESSIKDNFIRYNALWNCETGTLGGLSVLSDFLITSMKRLISRRFGLNYQLDKREKTSDTEILDSFLCEYINSCLTNYVYRPDLEKEVIETLRKNKLCYITGNHGNGKSIMLCRLSVLMRMPSNIILYYNEALSTSLDKRLECLTIFDYNLSSFLSLNFEVSAPKVNSSKLFSRKLVVREDIRFRLTRLQNMYRKLEGKYRVICLIDTDECIKNDFIQLLHDSLPAFSFVATMSSMSHESLGVRDVNVLPFGKMEISQYLVSKFEYHGKNLHKSVVDSIIKKVDNKNGNALWLSIITYLLLNLNAQDFTVISMNNEKKGERSIEDYLLTLVSKTPDNPYRLFEYLYDKFITRFDGSVISPVLSYLSVSKNGLRDEDLARLLGVRWNSILFASFRRWFSPFLVESPDNRRWRFVSSLFKKSVKSLCVSDPLTDERALAELLWNYSFYEPIRYSDLFYHLVNCKMYSRCGQLIIASNVNYIEPVREMFGSLTDNDIESLVNNISGSLSVENRILLVSKLLIMVIHNLFYEDMKVVRHIVDDLVQSINFKMCSISETAMVSLGVLLEEVVLFEKNLEDSVNSIKYSEVLLNVALRHDRLYPSKRSKDFISKSAYVLGRHYLLIGELDKANEYFKLI